MAKSPGTSLVVTTLVTQGLLGRIASMIQDTNARELAMEKTCCGDIFAPQMVSGVVAAEARLTEFQPQIAVTRAHAPNSPNVSASGLRIGCPRSACMSSSTTNVK